MGYSSYRKKSRRSPINFLYHASKYNTDCYAISAVGRDLLGDEIIQEIEKTGISCLIERVSFPTGAVMVYLENGIPYYKINEDVAWDYIPLTEPMKILAKQADAICFGTLAQRSKTSRKTIQTLLTLVPKYSYRILDVNIRQSYFSKEIIDSSLRICNVLKFNDEELLILKKIYEIEKMNDAKACKWLLKKFNLKFLILTAGCNYSAIYTHDNVSYIKTPKVEVVDTVGAGDSFTGGFISSILNGETLEEAHLIAVKRAAYVCTRAGAWVK